MASYSINEYAEIINRFDFNVIAALNPADFADFGVMDSKIYAAKLMRLFDQYLNDPVHQTMVIALATAVKNRKRILRAMTKFSTKPWFGAVRAFFNNHCVQYTYEEEEQSFSVVHIPSALPFIAARCWLQMHPHPTVDEFLENLWAAQFNLDSHLMDGQKAWESDFWENSVQKGGQNFERGKFNEDYWNTKAGDRYLLVNADGSLFGSEDHQNLVDTYDANDIEAWIGTKVFPNAAPEMPMPPPNDPNQEEPDEGINQLFQ